MEPLIKRRAFGLLTLGALGYLASRHLGHAQGADEHGGPALIVLWMGGGPSQLETFDPKPGLDIGGPTKAIATSVKGVRLAEGLPRLAERMDRIAVVRSVVGKEGDHERATTLMKSGRRPEVGLVHPALGAVCAAELPVGATEIPRYVSVLSDNTWGASGGYLGPQFDAFRIGDPANPVQDVQAPVAGERQQRRLDSLSFMEDHFAKEHPNAEARTLHRKRTDRALQTMASPQLSAFDLKRESSATKQTYGDTPFGRGCLTARRLVEVGVRCIEVHLPGWDTHVDNFGSTKPLCEQLDLGFSALLDDLAERQLLERTVVLCAGEFGRTPVINSADGRDHWPTGFSLAMAGRRIREGQVVGETSNGIQPPNEPIAVADVYATVLTALGIARDTENMTGIGRPVKLSEGQPIASILKET